MNSSLTSTMNPTGSSFGATQFKNNYSSLYSNSDSLSDSTRGDMNIEIELDELNQHDSMTSFVELIQSLVANKITPIYERSQVPTDMPPWMSFLHKKVADVYTNENVKFFIVRALINTQQVFRAYAKFWYAPLIGLLVNSSLSRHDKMDYYSLDLMVLLLSWHCVSVPQPTEQKLINRLFENLIRRCYDENRAILKNNLELLKTMTECWKHLIQVPVEIICNFLRCGNDSKKLATGIQLFGLVLANNIDNYSYPTDLSSVDFFKSLIVCMKDSSKTIHASAAEVVGMLLKGLDLKKVITLDADSFNELIGYLFEVFRELDESMFITCIHRVQINYPAISERFMTKLLFHLPSLYGEFKQMCAESILSSIKVLEDPLFKTRAFMEMISHRESSLQLVCLKMIYVLCERQSEEELARLMPIICDFKKHSNAACRYQMLLILILVYEGNQFKINESITANGLKIRQLTNETLLIALLDEDQTIRIMAQNFWTEKANMPSSTIDRMVLILG